MEKLMSGVAVDVRNLQFSYQGNKRPALLGMSFQIGEGESVGVIGPNGAGKSTLLLHINGILPEKQVGDPSVFIDGMPVIQENLFKIRQKVGLLFEDPDDQLFCPTVYEDVAFGPSQFEKPPGEIATLVEQALRMVGLEGFEHRSPHHLSNGEKQRVCLAGILACQPRVLALDEPTRGLDPRGKQQLKTILRSIPATKLIATHDLELVVELCKRTILIDEGNLIADGPTVELLADEDLMLSHGLEKPHILKHIHPH
jgi:cobalt/nickel transport system ATP-binding protein